MSQSRRVCLITPGHVSTNPRLVKEADALAAAGYATHVVAADYWPAFRAFDDDLASKSGWTLTRVRVSSAARRVILAARRKACTFLVGRGWLPTPAVALWAENDLVGQLTAQATATPAELYIGHYLPGLSAAIQAADRHRARVGFDAEDSHVDELTDDAVQAPKRAARAYVQQQYLPRCQHLTAAAPLIAEALHRRHGVRAEVILNVFPLGEAPDQPTDTPYLRGDGPATLYWFSQTLGPGRGLEPIVAAMARMRVPAHLHLRGVPSRGYADLLTQLTDRLGLKDRVHLHAPAPPDQMVKLAAGHDVGLALELTTPPNRAICLTNKIFTYLLAGTPVLMSRTPAQEQIAGEIGSAGVLIDLEQPEQIAAALDDLLGDRDRLRGLREGAHRLGRERFNWDVEQRRLIASVRRVLEEPR